MNLRIPSRFLLMVLLFLGLTVQAEAQSKKPKSPPQSAEATVGSLDIKVNYNAPSVRGREVWGELVPYGKVWRTGANSATTLEINQDVTIEGQKLAAGKYSIFTIPNNDKWTFIFNKEHDQWGAYNYNEGKDALRVDVQAGKSAEFTEQMLFDVTDEGRIVFRWADLETGFDLGPMK